MFQALFERFFVKSGGILCNVPLHKTRVDLRNLFQFFNNFMAIYASVQGIGAFPPPISRWAEPHGVASRPRAVENIQTNLNEVSHVLPHFL